MHVYPQVFLELSADLHRKQVWINCDTQNIKSELALLGMRMIIQLYSRADLGFEFRGGGNGLENFENRGGGGGGGGGIV